MSIRTIKIKRRYSSQRSRWNKSRDFIDITFLISHKTGSGENPPPVKLMKVY
jgi:hypothetical protein